MAFNECFLTKEKCSTKEALIDGFIIKRQSKCINEVNKVKMRYLSSSNQSQTDVLRFFNEKCLQFVAVATRRCTIHNNIRSENMIQDGGCYTWVVRKLERNRVIFCKSAGNWGNSDFLIAVFVKSSENMLLLTFIAHIQS